MSQAGRSAGKTPATWPSWWDRCKTRSNTFPCWVRWASRARRLRRDRQQEAELGAAVLAMALGHDVEQIHKTGVIGVRFEQASAQAGIGLWTEVAGGALLFVTGAIAMTAGPRRRRGRRRR